jgi:hypothetical protein
VSNLLNKPANRFKKSETHVKVKLYPYVKLLLKLTRHKISKLLCKVNNYELNRSRSRIYNVVIKVQTDMSKQIIFNILFLETDLKIVMNARSEIRVHGTVNERSEWTAE